MLGPHQHALAAEIPDAHEAKNAARGGQLRRNFTPADGVKLQRLLEDGAGPETAVRKLIKLARVRIRELDGDQVVGRAPAGEEHVAPIVAIKLDMWIAQDALVESVEALARRLDDPRGEFRHRDFTISQML